MDAKQYIPEKLMKKDHILVSQEQLNDLFIWRDDHRELVRGAQDILKDVVILAGKTVIHVQTVDDKDFTHRFKVYELKQEVLSMVWNRNHFTTHVEGANLPDSITKSETLYTDYKQSAISIYASLMAYMEHNREIVVKDTARVKKTKTKNRRKKKGKGESVIYLKRTIYTLDPDKQTEPNQSQTEGKRSYTKPEDPIPVRGHWRHYKNGNKTWIPAYTKPGAKGKEKKQKGRTYKFN